MRRAAIGFFLLLASLGPARAEDAPRDTLGWHVVQAGENLQLITKRYLGTPDLWPENVKLNPGIDPSLLQPGQRLRVIVARELPARRVEIARISREVDKNLQLSGWQDATEGDVLKPRDGVRTQRQSSAGLVFDDGAELTLNENAQVFIKDVSTTLTGVRRGTIEIERGQAELAFNNPRPDTTQIEVVTGSATTRPRVGNAGRSQTRARKTEEGGSQVMVYGGKAQVESAGAQVDVAQGMGTSVPQGAAPTPPEKLLPRPATVTPGRRTQWSYSNPRMRWRDVAGAVSYTVEVCRDAACSQLVARASVEGSSWQGDRLPRGDLFWRVTAAAPSGLDGYPSRPVPFRVLSETPDREPPVVVAALTGPGDVTSEGTFLLAPGGSVELVAHDDAAGVAEVRCRWDGGEWQSARGRRLAPPSAGEHLLEFTATDELGQSSPTLSVRVTRDGEAPPLPSVEVD